MSDISTKARLPILVEGNYVEWSALVRAHLIGVDLWEVVGPEAEELVPKGPKGVAAQRKKEQQAYARILETLSPPQLAYVLETENPRTAWQLLEEAHRSTSVNSILSLRRRFFRMTKSESESIMTWISRVRTAALELSRTEYPAKDLDVVMVITDGLPDEYAHVVSALDALPIKDLKVREVMTRIAGAEAQLQRAEEKASENSVALVAADRRGRANRGELTCFNCDGRGHYAEDCPSPRPAQSSRAPSGSYQGRGASHAKLADSSEETARLAQVRSDLDDEYVVQLF